MRRLLRRARESQARRTSYADVLHTRATLDQLHFVSSSLRDAETGAQGYALSGSEEFLATYHTAEIWEGIDHGRA